MKLEAFPLEFQGAMPILRKLQSAGFEAYYVGGSVRDILLNKPIHYFTVRSMSESITEL